MFLDTAVEKVMISLANLMFMSVRLINVEFVDFLHRDCDSGQGSRKACFLNEPLIRHLSTREASYNISTLVYYCISAQQ